ncbi:MAG TPA: cobinamide phosphate guanylyltransferase [Arcobacter sp.]|nr:cobinamide phosphate guanylyltransferase [Arcobacter sp.]HIP56052.1 cobinamide phosphate guanylyltransferase [Arcobacter sp.]
MSKILYFGGQKSGKSKLSEIKAIELSSSSKPYYIATYDNSYGDSNMDERISKHIMQRKDSFIDIEQTKNLHSVLEKNETYLIDCMSMWLLNNINLSQEELLKEIELLSNIDANIVFVLNDVSSGVIPLDSLSRDYVDKSGVIGQKLASICDEVYEVKLGLPIKLKG